jgi:hypothetical protein
MKNLFATVLATALLAGTGLPALAIDGHGNAANPERAVPNTGSVSGGPAHRDDPRVREATEFTKDGKPLHHAGDGHGHGHDHGGPRR